MEKTEIIGLAVAIFAILNLCYYKSMSVYFGKSFGNRWLQVWGNKFYFWQGSIFVSTGGTLLMMYLLKWTQVLNF